MNSEDNTLSNHIQFTTEDGNIILMEAEERDLASSGVAKAGLREAASNAVAEARALFEEAIKSVVRINAETFYKAISNLSHPPSEVEMTFGIKATGEAGNFVITKVGGEANYTFKLVWKSVTSK
jgi:hypothetical protein